MDSNYQIAVHFLIIIIIFIFLSDLFGCFSFLYYICSVKLKQITHYGKRIFYGVKKEMQYSRN